MTKHKIIKERFDLIVNAQNTQTKARFELNKNSKTLIAIALTSSRDDLLYYRGSQRIAINDVELFPENYESKLLMAGLNVPPDSKLVSLGEVPTGNGILDVWYNDSATLENSFVPYRVTVYTFSINPQIETNENDNP